ncbi:nuclear transport factor 2 family protein [Parabacteroides sp. FAFU027]|uniref:nuclear transport factor 2 family protein n=1 Tax=Parabacteroides sp. FAFU027 TaxID=2922715 RepID=UPI001FAF344F|nr:nuclear transport factor 2 family protein [Parabacteroides sp. FAFU027]
MKTTLAIILAGVLLLGLHNQVKAQELTRQQKSTIEQQVDSVFLTMVKAAEDLDYGKISTGVDDRYNAGSIVNGIYYAKYDSLVSVLKGNLRVGTKQGIEIKNKKITALSERISLLTTSGDADVEPTGGQSFHVSFFWSFVYEKTDNGWKVIQSHQSGVR